MKWIAVDKVPKEARKIPDLCGEYYISPSGEIYSKKRRISFKDGRVITVPNRIIGRNSSRLGYKRVMLPVTGNKKKFFFVHRLVALVFIENKYNKPYVNHKNGVVYDNRVENLEWCTQLENVHHAIKTGLINQRGEESAVAVLSDNKIIQIRNLWSEGVTQNTIARLFEIRQDHVSRVVNRKIWTHI